MAPNWEDFSEAPGDKRLIHIVKHGDTEALCGVNVDQAVIATKQCPRCRSLRREAMLTQGGYGA